MNPLLRLPLRIGIAGALAVLVSAPAAIGAAPPAFPEVAGGVSAHVAVWGVGADADRTAVVSVIPGEEATLPIVVSYDAPTTTPGPVSVQVDLPAGVEYVRNEALVVDAPGVIARWACDAQGPQVTCALRAADGSSPFPLLARHAAKVLMVVRASGVAPVDPGATAQVGAATARVSVPHSGSTLTASTTVDVVASSEAPRPRIIVTDVARPPAAGGMGREGYDLYVHDLGSAAAVATAGRPSIVLSAVAPPPGLGLEGVVAAGQGWKCRPVRGVTCSFTRTLPPGATAPPIKVRWGQRHDAGKIDERWIIRGTVAQAGEGGAVVSTPVDTDIELVLHDTEVQLLVDARAPRGLHIVGGEKPRELHARLTNAGVMFARGASVRVTVPKGITVSALTRGWRCSGTRVVRCRMPGSLPAGATTTVVLGLSAPHHAETTTAEMLVEPLGPLGKVRGEAQEMPVQVLDPGDPAARPSLAFRNSGAWEPWTTGEVQTPSAGDPFSYRITLTSSGGAAIRPGQQVRVRQRIGPRMGRVALTGGPGVRCDGPGVNCTIRPLRVVPPGAVVGTIVVTTNPEREGAERDLGPIVSTIAGDRETVAMAMEVVTPPHSLRPEMRVTRDPTSGGVGSFVMVVQNTGKSPARDLRAVGVLPPGLEVTSIQAPGAWRCAEAPGRRITCAYRFTLAPGDRTAGVSVRMAAAPGSTRTSTVSWTAEARSGEGLLRRSTHEAKVAVRGSLVASGSATPEVVTVTPDEATRRVALDGIGSTGSGMSLDYRWSQRCLTKADARVVRQCRGVVSPVARIDDATMASTTVLLPRVRTRTAFVFSLAIADGSATSTALVLVRAVPPALPVGRPGREAGISPEAAARRAAIIARARTASRSRTGAARSAARARRAKAANERAAARAANRQAPRIRIAGGLAISAQPGEDLPLATTLSGRWRGTVTYEWIKAAGGGSAVVTPRSGGRATLEDPPARGLVVVWVIARDQAGHAATAITRVRVGAVPDTQAGALLNDAYQAARAARPLPFDLGRGITGTLRDLEQPANPGGAFGFARADVRTGGVAIRGGSGTITNEGIRLTGGTLQLPAAWRLRPVVITPADPLVLAFAEGGRPAALVGHARTAASFAVLPLPDGWAGTTDITFAPGAWHVAANGVGGSSGTASVEGELRRDGSYRIDVRATGIVNVGGTPVDLAGTAESSAGRVTSTVTGSIASPIALADGVNIESMTASWAPRPFGAVTSAEGPPAITGTGRFELTSGDAPPLALDAALAYSGANDWRLALIGTGDGTWTPVPGFSMGPGAFEGFIGDVAGARTWGLKGTVPVWNPTTRLSVRDIAVELTDSCGEAPAPACPATGLFLGMRGTGTLDAAGAGDVTAPVKAVIGMGPAGGASLSGALPDLDVGPGMTLANPALDVSYGIPADQLPGDVQGPDFGARDEGGYTVRVAGGARIASLGTFDRVTAQVTAAGWAFGGYARDGVALGAGNGRQDGAWFGWASYDTSMKVDVAGRGQQDIPVSRNLVSVAGVYLAPEWFASVAGGRPQGAMSVITVTPGTGAVDTVVRQPGTFRIEAGTQRLTASDVQFVMTGDATRGMSVTARAGADLQVRGVPGGADWVSVPPLALALSADGATSTVSGTLELRDGGDWTNAFGVPGFVVRSPSFRLGFNTITTETDFPFTGAGVLPQDLAGPLRVPAGTPVQVGGDLAPANECVNVQVGDSRGSSDALSLDNGALRARYFEFVVAPTGCAQSKTLPAIAPGLAVVFDGDVMGTTVDIATPITLDGGLVMNARAPVGDLLVGPLRLFGANVAVHVDSRSGRDEVDLTGGVEMFGATTTVTGPLQHAGGVTSGTLAGSAAAPVQVSGFTVRNLALSVPVSYAPDAVRAEVTASGDLDLMGGVVRVPAFRTALAGGRVEEASAQIDTEVVVFGRAKARGRYEMLHRATAGTLAFTGKVVFTTESGVAIGSDAKPATMVIDPRCATLDGPITNGFFTAHVRGTIAHAAGCTQQVPTAAGGEVTPQVGDYGFSATEVGLNVRGFNPTGTVRTGTVGGTHFDKVQSTFAVGTENRKSDVTVAGDFAANGRVKLVGVTNVGIAGYDLRADVEVDNGPAAGYAESVKGSSRITVFGNDVQLTGDFTTVDGTRRATLTGEIKDLTVKGTKIESARLRLIDGPAQQGFTADASITGGTGASVTRANGTLTFFRARDGGEFLYSGKLVATFDVPTLSGTIDGTVDFTNCDQACTTRVPFTFELHGKLYRFGVTFGLNVAFDESGNFDVSTSASEQRCTGRIDLAVVQGQACIGYTINMRVQSVSPYASFSASASANAEVRYWEVWEWDWSRWYTVSANIGASVQLDPFRICVRIPVVDRDACI